MQSILACESCDQLHQRLPLQRGEKALCLRCGDRLYGSSIDSLERTLALNLAALALLFVANAAPSEAVENKSEDGKESGIARFFHHKDKNEEESQKVGETNKDPSQEGAKEKKRHGFFHRIFHREQKGEKDKQDQKDEQGR